jgi:hypothetical protein
MDPRRVAVMGGDEQRISLMEAVSALGGSAEAWYQDQRMFYGVDVRDLVPTVRVPTLILGRTGTQRIYCIESARYLAEHMPDATLMELEGSDVLPYIGDSGAVLDAIEGFTTGSRRPRPPTRARDRDVHPQRGIHSESRASGGRGMEPAPGGAQSPERGGQGR